MEASLPKLTDLAAHTPDSEVLDHTDLAHVIVNLIQCNQCSRPLRTPLRLPCGNTVCRECLPVCRPRTGITYPVAEGRDQEFTCPWQGSKGCTGDHCIGDCGTDVLLGKLIGVFEELLVGADENTPRSQSGDDGALFRWKTGESGLEMAHLGYGRLKGVYKLALEGRFPRDAKDITYEPAKAPESAEQDSVQAQTLRENLRAELDCQVCYALILDPMTTACGHSFCRDCAARVLDHADLCPICRRKLGTSTVQSEPTNDTIARLVDYFFPDLIAARRQAALAEASPDYENSLPIFVCALSFPTVTTALHVFEPRYRLMIRRVIESGNGKFGMVMYNQRGGIQLGRRNDSPFQQYGTLVKIERYELLPDGRSFLVVMGMSRFKIIDSAMLDGYFVAKTECVRDISLADEERLESVETSTSGQGVLTQESTSGPPLDSMSTQELLVAAKEFINNQRLSGARWLHPRIFLIYGPIPVDAFHFSWWFASILPIPEEEKYPMLYATSVRERLKISVTWIRQLEARDR